MSANKWTTTVGAKLLSDLVIFSTFSSDVPLDFNKSMQKVLLKCLTYFLASINTNEFWNIPKEKYFAKGNIF